MDTEMHFEETDQWLIARLRGALKITGFTAGYERIAIECKRAGKTKALVDMTGATIPLAVADKFAMGKAAVVFAQAGIQVAVYGLPSQVDTGKIGELTAVNRGVNIRVFTDLDEAQTWLSGGGSKV